MKNFLIPNKKNKYKPYLLRKIALVFYSVILIAVNSFGGIFGIENAQASTITQTNIINLANQQRQSAGLNALNSNAKLAAAALAKANDMFEKQYWDHFGPNGESPWQFIRAAGYNYVYAGENLAKGFRTAEGVHEAWMASPTHKANIMSPNYKDIGIAVVNGTLDGKQTTLVVQMFGNLTADIAGITETNSSEKVSSGDAEVTVGNEQGEIKSIRITSPENSSIITDPGMQVKGEVTNVTGKYTVEVFDSSSVVGESEYDKSDWIFEKDSDWSEGEHTIQAGIKGSDTKSEEISFTIDSVAPEVDKSTIAVKEIDDSNVELSFKINDDWESVTLVTGNHNVSVESINHEENVVISIEKDKIGEKTVLMVSDFVGNINEIDITEYFKTDNTKEILKTFSILGTDLGDKISIGIVLFIFVLLCIEIFVYIKKGKLAQIKEDLFTIGVWWIILAVAVFNGYAGIIN